MIDSGSKPRPRRKKLLRWLVGLLTLGLVLIALAAWALPGLLGTRPVRRVIVAEVNRRYAPSSIELEGLEASWTEPLKLQGLVLKDDQGKAVVSSPEATLDRSLWNLLTMRPDYGTLTLHGAKVDIERSEVGRIDLAEALGPFLAGESVPGTKLALAIEGGTLELMSPELAEPLEAERLDMDLNLVPGPIAWEIDLAEGDDRAMGIEGHYDSSRPDGTEALVAITGQAWPLAVGAQGVVARMVFDGELNVRLDGPTLSSDGEAVLTDLTASGPPLSGDQPRLERLEAAWDLDWADDAGPTIRRLEVDSEVFTVGLADGQVAEAAPLDGESRWRGRVDLAALGRQLPNTLRLKEDLRIDDGQAELALTIEAPSEDGVRPFAVRADLSGLAATNADRRVALEEPITLAARVVPRPEGATRIDRASLRTAFFEADGSGDLDQGVVVRGTVDLAGLDRRLRDWVELGDIALFGNARFGGDYRLEPSGGEADAAEVEASRFTARLAVEGQALGLVGLTEEPIRRDQARLDLLVQGPASAAGLPTAWRRLRLASKAESYDLAVNVVPEPDAYGLNGRVVLTEPTPTVPASDAEEPADAAPAEPITLTFDAGYRTAEDRLDLTRAVLEHDYGLAEASGRIEALMSERRAELRGRLEPDWDRLSAAVADAVEPNARLDGRAHPFHLVGPLSGASIEEILEHIQADVGLELTEATVFGMQAGPARLRAVVDQGRIAIDPVQTTLNGGRVDLRPTLDWGRDGEPWTIGLEPGSTIERVEITREVSEQILAYVAPVLKEATAVRGQVSTRFDRLSIPWAGPGGFEAAPVPNVEGDAETLAPAGGPSSEFETLPDPELNARVVFHDVTYGPGPLMSQILGLTRASEASLLTLDQTVDVAIADGRVHQSGLEIEATEVVRIQLEGSVGLDQTLALRAGVPLDERMFGGQEVLSDIFGGTRVGLPIGGTLSRPRLDREALRAGMRQQGGRLLDRAAAVGARELFRLLEPDDRPNADSDAPAPEPESGSDPGSDVGGSILRGLLREVIPPNREHRP